MMANFKSLLLNLISEHCYDNYFVENNFMDVPCFKAVLSKGLGLAIIAGSVLVKVPQIMKILSNKSVEGINLISVLLDLTAITFFMSYSFVSKFPFSAWGDSTFLAIQTATIAILLLYYGGSKLKAMLFTVFYGGICYVLMSGITPLDYLWTTQCFNIPLLLLGKLSQAYTNYKNKSTGQLSAATCFMLFAGSLARIFTSIQETGDQIIILTYSCSVFANGVIVAQLFKYWNKSPAGSKKQPQSGGKQQHIKAQQKSKSKSKKAD